MPTYLMLTTLTDQGLQTLRTHPERLKEVNRDIEELGAKVLQQWCALGNFDFVNIVEAPDAATIAEYRAWKREHVRSDPFPGGESLDAAAWRYARGFRRLVERDVAAVLVVCHEIPIRYGLNAAAGSGDLDGPVHEIPNATPFLFD